MSGIRSVLSTTAIIVGGGLALLTGGIAKADPAAPAVPTPNVPGFNLVEQFADPSKAPQLLQSAASILTGTPVTPAVPAVPLSPPPVASASLNVPQPTLPGMPAATPAVPVSAPGAAQPGAQLTLPQVPGLPVPLPQQISLPTEVTSLLGSTPVMTPEQAAAAAAGAPSAASPMTAPALASLFPTAALP